MFSIQNLATFLCAAVLTVAPAANALYSAQPMTQNKPLQAKSSPATLYFHPKCPHCHKVTDYLKSIHKSVTTKDISNPIYKKELQEHGQTGVPVMIVGKDVIPGADKIIAYLKQHPEVMR